MYRLFKTLLAVIALVATTINYNAGANAARQVDAVATTAGLVSTANPLSGPTDYSTANGHHSFLTENGSGTDINRFGPTSYDRNSFSQQAGDVTTTADGDGSVTITGELKQWHKVTLNLAGPFASETGEPNPFTDYRMDVTFSSGSLSYVVPGFFAADGNAANSSSTQGTVWRAHLSPDITGTWSYVISFKEGSNVAMDGGGTPLAPYHGKSGTFTVGPTDKTGRDLRGKGRLEYVGKRYLQFAGNGQYFIKVGADAPENFLNYTEFDGTYNNGGTDYTKNWGPHIGDWQNGDPIWQSDKGKGIIGAINYLASKGMNVFSFLTYNVGGDSKDVWPFIAPAERLRYDVSKLDQWAIVFDHATTQGMYLHFKTQETENDNGSNALDGGNVGPERKLYYRELIARFGHNLALNWNLGEENSQTEAQRKAMAQFFYETDPYRHNIVLHTYPGQQEGVYRPLLGNASSLTGASLQIGWSGVHGETLQWIAESTTAGKPWVVANDEQGGANNGIPPDPGWPGYGGGGPARDDLRHEVLWGNLMAGGAGVEAYFGYGHPDSDLTADDWRSRAGWWDMNRHALTLFKDHLPFWNMTNHNDLIGNGGNSDSGGYCLAQVGEVYAIYLPEGGSKMLDLSSAPAQSFAVQWFDPRTGGPLKAGSITQVTGGSPVSIGQPPAPTDEDWVALITLDSDSPTATPTPSDSPTATATPEDPPTATPTPTDPPAGQAVVSFTLINAETDAEIRQLKNNDTVNLATLPATKLNIRANTNPPVVGSVRFALDGNPNYQTENVTPYALEGDTNGNYNPWTPSPGQYTLSATPYSGSNAGGAAGNSLTISFTVIDNAMAPTATPTAPASVVYLPAITN